MAWYKPYTYKTQSPGAYIGGYSSGNPVTPPQSSDVKSRPKTVRMRDIFNQWVDVPYQGGDQTPEQNYAAVHGTQPKTAEEVFAEQGTPLGPVDTSLPQTPAPPGKEWVASPGVGWHLEDAYVPPSTEGHMHPGSINALSGSPVQGETQVSYGATPGASTGLDVKTNQGFGPKPIDTTTAADTSKAASIIANPSLQPSEVWQSSFLNPLGGNSYANLGDVSNTLMGSNAPSYSMPNSTYSPVGLGGNLNWWNQNWNS